ncbi:helix-turn-helix transcriptional regulator [Streptomyces kanamyceticus]|uniref:Helix-turn-helix transcriptional regulator n=1 Tax=Streptomyces kanamyceticus TaxID=1967 RepID=A0A5J6G8N1_STRKN|nr:LuxR family transcriptional regulator [Streptomyces kanamyceticus]QEU90964.1 helix-turn-helix transcriptional regulator [Streptomyces kanamyceticus]
MILVERHIELHILKRMLDDCTLTGRKVALIAGPGGVGKTTLLTGFSEYAKDMGALVLSASGARSEQTHGLGVLRQIFRSFELSADYRERLEFTLAMQEVESQDPLLSTYAVDELTDVLLAAAEGRPLVLALDDMQYADSASLQTLLLMLRRFASRPVIAVFAEWRISNSTRPGALSECIKQPYCRYLNLSPFSLDGVIDRLRQQGLGEARARRIAPSFLAATGGSPLLLQALCQDRLSGPAAPDSEDADGVLADDAEIGVSVGAHFQVAIEACLHRWDPQLLEVARGLAALGGPASAAVLVRLLGGERRTVAETLSALTDTGLLRSGWFCHAAVPAAALSGLDGDTLAALYGRTALLLHQDGAVPSKVAERLVAAGGTPQQWSVGVLREAARQAMREGEPGRAAEFLEAAHGACGDARERAEILEALARVLWLVKPSAVTSLLVPLRSALDDGSLSGRGILLLSSSLAWQGGAEDAAAVLGHVDARQYECDLIGTAELMLVRQWLRWVSPLKPPLTGKGRADGAAWVGGSGGDEADDCESWSDLVKSAEQVLQSCRLADALPVVVLSALLTLAYDNRLDDAQRWCAMLKPEAEAHRAEAWVALLAVVESLVALRRGHLVDAERHARRALTVLPPHNWGAAVGLPLSCLVHATTAMGRTGEAEVLIKEALPEAHQNAFWLHFLHARGRFYVAINRPYAALGDLQECGSLLANSHLDCPSFLPWRSDLAEAWLLLQDPVSARAALEEQLMLACVEDARVHGRSLRIMAATLDLPDRAATLRDAVAALFKSGDQLELAIALADASDVELECGRFSEFRISALQAKRMAQFCGAEPLYWRLRKADAPEKRDDAPGNRRNPPGFTALSEAERKVAALAAQGRSNRDISRTLFITVSTVEQHLTKVYRKLRVSSRSSLPAELYLVGSPE